MDLALYATSSEVLRAFCSLTPKELRRLHRRAQSAARGLAARRPLELLSEAVCTTFIAARALEQGLPKEGRPWRRGVDFVAHLTMTLRGRASDERAACWNRCRVPLDLADPANDRDPHLPDLVSPSPEETVIGMELADVLLSGMDDGIHALIEAEVYGLTPQQICYRAGMNQEQYAEACGRLQAVLQRMTGL